MTENRPTGKDHHNYKHGHWVGKKPSPTFISWQSMMKRCYDKNNNRFGKYGAAGITVCEKWHNFQNFLDDMGNRPSKSHSIDRVDNSLGYSPNNTRWATKSEQAVNRKTTRFFTINGETKCLKHWASEYNLPYLVVYKRVFYRGWDIMRALTTPRQQKTPSKRGC
jgi:hypothetical protein